MNTYLVWILFSFGGYTENGSSVNKIEQFITLAECERVQSVIIESMHVSKKLRCVQANIVK